MLAVCSKRRSKIRSLLYFSSVSDTRCRTSSLTFLLPQYAFMHQKKRILKTNFLNSYLMHAKKYHDIVDHILNQILKLLKYENHVA